MFNLFEEEDANMYIWKHRLYSRTGLSYYRYITKLFSTSNSAKGESLFHPSSIINDNIILQTIHEDSNGIQILDELVDQEDKEYMDQDFMTEFYNTCCQPYVENLTEDDLLKNIIFDQNPSDADDDY